MSATTKTVRYLSSSHITFESFSINLFRHLLLHDSHVALIQREEALRKELEDIHSSFDLTLGCMLQSISDLESERTNLEKELQETRRTLHQKEAELIAAEKAREVSTERCKAAESMLKQETEYSEVLSEEMAEIKAVIGQSEGPKVAG
jgi:septal ring factor EnvC (AmiA/AmiB activator)